MSSLKNCRSIFIALALSVIAVSVIESAPSHKPKGHNAGGQDHQAQQQGSHFEEQSSNHDEPAILNGSGLQNFGSKIPDVGSLGQQNYNYGAPAIPSHNGFSNIDHGVTTAIPNYNRRFGVLNYESNFRAPGTHINQGVGIPNHYFNFRTPGIQNFDNAAGHASREFHFGSPGFPNFDHAAGIPNHEFSNLGLVGLQNQASGIPAHEFATSHASAFAGVPSLIPGYPSVRVYRGLGGINDYHYLALAPVNHIKPVHDINVHQVEGAHSYNDNSWKKYSHPTSVVASSRPVKYAHPVPVAPSKHYKSKHGGGHIPEHGGEGSGGVESSAAADAKKSESTSSEAAAAASASSSEQPDAKEPCDEKPAASSGEGSKNAATASASASASSASSTEGEADKDEEKPKSSYKPESKKPSKKPEKEEQYETSGKPAHHHESEEEEEEEEEHSHEASAENQKGPSQKPTLLPPGRPGYGTPVTEQQDEKQPTGPGNWEWIPYKDEPFEGRDVGDRAPPTFPPPPPNDAEKPEFHHKSPMKNIPKKYLERD